MLLAQQIGRPETWCKHFREVAWCCGHSVCHAPRNRLGGDHPDTVSALPLSRASTSPALPAEAFPFSRKAALSAGVAVSVVWAIRYAAVIEVLSTRALRGERAEAGVDGAAHPIEEDRLGAGDVLDVG